MQAVFYIVPGMMMIMGVFMLTAETNGLKISKKFRRRFARDTSNIFSGTKFYITKSAYQNATLAIFLAMIILSVLLFSKIIMIVAVFLLLISYPREYLGKAKLPFHYICEMIRSLEKDKKDREIYQAMSILKNMTVLQSRSDYKGLGTDVMIEQIVLIADLTKPAYLKMIGLLRLGQKQEARDAFVNDVQTPMSEQMASFLITMDELKPSELSSMIVVAQERMEQERITKERQSDEAFSNLVYAPIFINALLVIMNFLIITFFYDQKEALNMFFNF